jgi:Flp pilus assembly protein TadG
MTVWSETRDAERGQLLAAMGAGLIAICALVAVAADLGYFFDYRRRMQTGVDAAAMAGAEQLRRAASDSEVRSAATNGAASNGFTDGASSAQVTVNHPPASGFYAGNSAFVEAIISQPRPTIFMSLLGFQSATVSTRAVAGAQDSPNCIYALNPTTSSAFNTSGGANVNASCGIVVDSSSGSALNSSGGASVTGTEIAVAGNATGCCFSPTPQTDVPPEPDPLAGLAAPTFSGCTYTNVNVPGGVRVLTPGVYCGGIKISGGANVTFMPGLYVLYGGGLNQSGGGTMNGTGVTFYNTGGDNPYAYKPISISGGSAGKLSAPTSGPLEGILFFQDRSITSSQTNTVSGGSTLALEGVLYFPTTPINFSGGSTGGANYTIVVAQTLTFSGMSTFRANYNSLPEGNPIKRVALAE